MRENADQEKSEYEHFSWNAVLNLEIHILSNLQISGVALTPAMLNFEILLIFEFPPLLTKKTCP